ncbi:hypothetical protein [Aquimarina sp. I32.4]|uniref:hypothetical protein n=1 Tax=Aquimarina sp. I32.4 TaxID=2053903 RepID=UPI000CDE8A56|nr:hypothetical protein [Aquimarina sp. I32.4]
MINKISYFVIFIVILSACSEGDIIENDINNFTAELQNCFNDSKNTFVFFKVDNNTNSALSMNFTSTTFDITPETNDISISEPTTIPLNADSNQLIYREFENTITSNYFCSIIPPSNSTITEELVSSDGTLEISYSELDPTANTQKRYIRTLTVLNSTLLGDGRTIRNEVLVLGSDTIEADISIDFTGDIKTCSETTPNTFTIYKVNTTDRNKAISLNFTDETFDVIPVLANISEDTPITITLNTTSNIITYREFSDTIPEPNVIETFCNNLIPSSISTTRELKSTNGVIEISYKKLAPVEGKERVSRTYTLKNIILEGTGTPITVESLIVGTEEITLE